LPTDLPRHLAAEIHAGWLRIHSNKLEGADTGLCLREAYDVCATALFLCGHEFDDSVLRSLIPSWVVHFAAAKEWLPPGPPDHENLMKCFKIGSWRVFAAFCARVRAGCLRIQSKRLEGADTDLCLREAYDVCATAARDFSQELNDRVLCELIPTVLFHWATGLKWLPPGPRDQLYEDLTKCLSGRIAYWQAEALTLAEQQKRRSRLHEALGAIKELKRLIKGPREEIPESIVRTTLAMQYGIKQEEVTWDQIRHDLSRLDYPAVEVVPSDPATDDGQLRFGYLLSDVMREVPDGIREVFFDHCRFWVTKADLVIMELDAAAPPPPTAQPESHKAETIGVRIDRLRDECRLTTATTPTEHTQEATRKGDPTLLGEKNMVNFQIAREYLGISERQRQKLCANGALIVVGGGHNRKITTESLRRYLPQENPNKAEQTRPEPNSRSSLVAIVRVLMRAGRTCMAAKVLKVSEIAERFRVSRDAVYLWIRQGKIPPECVIRIAGTVRVDEGEFEKRLRSGDLCRRSGRKLVGGKTPCISAEDNFTLKREGLSREHRWTGENSSVLGEHPYSPELRALTT
jgi:hypothetical protein